MDIVIVRSGVTSLGNNGLDLVVFVVLALGDIKVVMILGMVAKNSIKCGNDADEVFYFLFFHNIVDSLFPM